MVKYYFGYNIFNSRTFPFKWMEENGIAVGSRPAKILQQNEISFNEYRNFNLAVLSENYPLKEVKTDLEPEV